MAGRVRYGAAALAALALGIGGAVAIAAGTGATATTLGDAERFVNSTSSGPNLFFQATDDDEVRSYRVPADGGVITSWSVRIYSALADGQITLKVLAPVAGDDYRVVASDAQPVAAGGERTLTFAARLPVSAAARLGVQTASGIAVRSSSASATPGIGEIRRNATTLPGTDPFTSSLWSGGRLAISAVVEPDADRDGYGDVTQDACPADPAAQTGPCVADVSVAIAAGPTAIAVGDMTAYIANVAVSPARAGAPGVSLAQELPAGMSLVSAFASAGTCSGTRTVACALGDVPAGGSRTVVIVARATAAGSQSSTVAVAATTPDPDASNDRATAVVTVRPAAAATTSAGCVVPPVKGLGRAQATALLKTFGCRAGRITTRPVPKRLKGRRTRTVVVSSNPKAGKRLAARAKVDLRLAKVAR